MTRDSVTRSRGALAAFGASPYAYDTADGTSGARSFHPIALLSFLHCFNKVFEAFLFRYVFQCFRNVFALVAYPCENLERQPPVPGGGPSFAAGISFLHRAIFWRGGDGPRATRGAPRVGALGTRPTVLGTRWAKRVRAAPSCWASVTRDA